MIISQKALIEKVGLSYVRLAIYLCRAEFSKIFKFKRGKTTFYKNITPQDIERLIALKKVNRSSKYGYNGELALNS